MVTLIVIHLFRLDSNYFSKTLPLSLAISEINNVLRGCVTFGRKYNLSCYLHLPSLFIILRHLSLQSHINTPFRLWQTIRHNFTKFVITSPKFAVFSFCRSRPLIQNSPQIWATFLTFISSTHILRSQLIILQLKSTQTTSKTFSVTIFHLSTDRTRFRFIIEFCTIDPTDHFHFILHLHVGNFTSVLLLCLHYTSTCLCTDCYAISIVFVKMCVFSILLVFRLPTIK